MAVLIYKLKKGVKKMKELLKTILKSNKILIKLIMLVTNKSKGKGNNLFGYYIRKNTLTIAGNENSIINKENFIFRNNRINIQGNNNVIIFGNNVSFTGNNMIPSILVFGDNNKIEIDDNCRFESVQIFIRGNNNRLHIHKNCSAVFAEFHFEYIENEIEIGEYTSFHGRSGRPIQIALDEKTKIIIGSDCMISNNIQIRSSDSHSIVDLKNKRLNYAQDIVIGNHCWLGLNSILLKGTNIPNNSVVAAGSICTKKYDVENTILAGNPAKVVKHNINWDRERF